MEKATINLAKGFLKSGFNVDFILFEKKGTLLKEIPKEIRILTFNLPTKRKFKTIFFVFPLAFYLYKERPIALVSNSFYHSIPAVVAKILSFFKGKLILIEHNNISFLLQQSHRETIFRILIKLFYPLSNKIVAVSKGVAESLITETSLPKDKVQVIYNSIFAEEILEKMKHPVSHPWLCSKKTPIILSVGRLTYQKDFSTLLKAFHELKYKLKLNSAKLIILGEGEERITLERLARELKIDKDLDMPGIVLNPYPYFKNADVFVLSSRYEGLSLVLLEAMTCGIPVVSTDCPYGPREILENGKYGKLVPVGNYRELAKAIKETILNPPNSKYLIERAKCFWFPQHNQKYLQLINDS